MSMTVRSPASEFGSELTVVYEDLPGQVPPEEAAPPLDLTFMLWPRHFFEAANDSRLLLHCEMIDLTQRNLNASFSLLRRLAGARNLGEVIELQTTHFGNQLAASISQSEELTVLSIKTALEFLAAPNPARDYGLNRRV